MERHIPGPAGKGNFTENYLENQTTTDGLEAQPTSRTDGVR